MDWETLLKTASKPPSQTEDNKRQKTEDEIRKALSGYEPLKGRPYVVYAKGSYANNTNVRLNYDVDIAVEYGGFFFFDLMFGAKGAAPADLGITVPSGDPYTRDEFKADVKGALDQAFGSSAISTGRIAYRVRGKATTLPADVVPCWQYRRYDSVSAYHAGSRVFPSNGGCKDNFPEIQRTRGTKKNDRTSRRYKRMVRALKKLQTTLVAEGKLTEELPSYLTECLVYNVPDECFNNSTYTADMRFVLATIFNATRSAEASDDWLEVHQLQFLFKGTTQWTIGDVHKVATAAWNRLGFE
jgi:hypothetical protein